jgi:haloalkane dehalogenase
MSSQDISAEFPFESKYVKVQGAKIHYIDEGEGDPILFLHGNPTSSYLWRNIIPHLTKQGRCIAPDLIGMGKSDKPDLAYRFVDHSRYVEGFIEALGLKSITLVIHDWGSALGFHYAMRHESNVKGIAFMEAIVKPVRWDGFPTDFKIGFKLMRTPGIGFLMISVANFFLTKLLPQTIVRKLTPEEVAAYNAPFTTVKSRKPIRVWPQEIPIDGSPEDTHNIVSSYSNKLQESVLPKLLFYAQPGGLIDEAGLQWCRTHFQNLTTIDIGPGHHFIQEDNPHMIGEELSKWVEAL